MIDKGALKVQAKGYDAPINASLSGFQEELLAIIRSNAAISYDELANLTQKDRTTVMRNIGKLGDRGHTIWERYFWKSGVLVSSCICRSHWDRTDLARALW